MFAISLVKKAVCLQESFVYQTDDISFKEMPYHPSLVPIGSEEEKDYAEDTSFEGNGDYGRMLFSSESYLFKIANTVLLNKSP